MPPKQATGARGRPQAGSSRQAAAEDSSDAASSDPFDSADDEPPRRRQTAGGGGGASNSADATAEKSIPKDLLTRILHDLFEKDATRVSRDANAAVGKCRQHFHLNEQGENGCSAGGMTGLKTSAWSQQHTGDAAGKPAMLSVLACRALVSKLKTHVYSATRSSDSERVTTLV
ncbi:hypothetical protein PWT90_00381 [Aphanocladium album]|nr:hypothetical protein PWT90_00381 [Aphanocladium album]